jgi:hypothetical protein
VLLKWPAIAGGFNSVENSQYFLGLKTKIHCINSFLITIGLANKLLNLEFVFALMN